MDKLFITLGIIIASLTVGYLTQCAAARSVIPLSFDAAVTLRRRIQTVGMFVFLPLSAMLSLWGLPTPDPRLLVLPVLGLCSWILGGVAALFFARWLNLDRPQTGSLYCCGTFSNIGAVGTLTAAVFLGEAAIAPAALYRMFEELYYFSVAYPTARRFSVERDGAALSGSLKFSPILMVIIFALASGMALNLSNVPRPSWGGGLASAAMLTATVLLLFGIGLGVRFSSVGRYVRPCLAAAAIKFLLIPAIIIPPAIFAGLGHIDDGLPLKVVAILSCMPAAMTALVPPSLFRLDLDLANACWLTGTAALIFILPALLCIMPHL